MACIFNYKAPEGYVDCFIPDGRADAFEGVAVRTDEAKTCVQCSETMQFQLLTSGIWEYDYFQDSFTLDMVRPMVMFDKGRTPFTVRHVPGEILDFLIKYLDMYRFMPVVRWYVAKDKAEESAENSQG